MITFSSKGSFKRTKRMMERASNADFSSVLNRYGKQGVSALSAATPKDSGKTASSWTFEVEENRDNARIVWSNSNVNKGVNIAVILQYGHGTRNGGWVEGRDYINPAIRPIFDTIAEMAWKEVVQK